MRWSQTDLMNYEARRGEGAKSPNVGTAFAKESELQEAIIQACRKKGWIVFFSRMDKPTTCQVGQPDLIICDRAMPAMTGYELLERIRGVYPQYRDVPFIFLTALTDQRDRAAVRPLKPTAYLEKPLDFDVLLNTIEQALANTRR